MRNRAEPEPEPTHVKAGRLVRDSDGYVAVIYSEECGGGWSTGAGDDERARYVFCPDLAYCIHNNCSRNYLESVAHGVLGGYSHDVRYLTLAWLPPGTRFIIQEYDGAESVLLLDEAPNELRA